MNTMIEETKKHIKLTDGRILSYMTYGKSSGKVLILIHGTPFSSMMWAMIKGIKESHFRIIAVDRPGYGHSTYNSKGSLEHFHNDIKELLKELKIKKAHIAGVSGGGPYVLACALKIPDLLDKVVLISSVGPAVEEAIGDMNANRNLYKYSTKFPQLIAFQNQMLTKMIQKNPLRFISLGKKKLKGKDLELINQDQFALKLSKAYEDGCRQKTSRHKNPMTDDIFYTANWPIPLGDIQKKVTVYWGEKDRSIGNQCKYMAEQIPDTEAHIYPNEGHLLIYVHMETILKQLDSD